MDTYLPKLRQLIKTAQLEQAQEHLSTLSSRPDTEKHDVIEMLALASDKTAFSLLSFLIGKITLDNEIRERLFQLTTDRAHLNFTFANILLDQGDRPQMIHYSPLFRHILSKETDEKLLNRIIRTAGRLKLEILMDDVAEFIFYDHMALKADAVKALERMGSAKALETLKQVAQTDKCDQDVLDAIDILKINLSGDTALADTIEQKHKADSFEINLGQLTSGSIMEKYKASIYFATHGSQVARALAGCTENRDNQDHDLLINLLRLTAITIPKEAIASLFTLVSGKKINPQIRFMIYNAMEAFPSLESVAGIISGILDPSMHVRMAAVKVLEKHCSDYIVAEIKNKIESGTKTGETLVHSILDAKAASLTEALMDSDTFTFIASNYLNKSASIPVIEAFIEILKERNLKSTIKKYTSLRDEKSAIKKKEFILVSPSHIFLDVYTKIIDTCGYSALPFIGTQEAFEAIVFKKPDIIVCDLFFNNMTGLDLAMEIREMYTPQEVPIVISTLQKGFSRSELDAVLKKVQINHFCNFPATPVQIKSWINQA